jgi:GTP-binding protein
LLIYAWYLHNALGFVFLYTFKKELIFTNYMKASLDAKYLISSPDLAGCPKADRPEYAFIGRSNVGKSSLINMITGRSGLAKTSQTPGKTQLINHFDIENTWYLVDLPGYGYARVSKTEREKFEAMINGYIMGRSNLICTFVLVDIRHEPQKLDLAFMQSLGEAGVPFCIVFTKADKLSKTQQINHLEAYSKVMLQSWEAMPQYFLSSSADNTGKEEIRRYIDSLHQYFTAQTK